VLKLVGYCKWLHFLYVVFMLIFLYSLLFSWKGGKVLHGLGVSSLNIRGNDKIVEAKLSLVVGFDVGCSRRMDRLVKVGGVVLDYVFISAVFMGLDGGWGFGEYSKIFSGLLRYGKTSEIF